MNKKTGMGKFVHKKERKLTEKQQLEVEAAKIGMECYNSFYFFFITFWPEMSGDKYIDAPHIKYICDTIQEHAMKVIRGEISMKTLIINVPPGSSKSTIATIAFPMWIWIRAPWLASTNVSYSSTLSARHAKKARAITDSKKWDVLFGNIFTIIHGKEFTITTQNKNSIENNFKGERFNSSVGGTITGMHADFIIKDDMQNPKTAKSDTERNAANLWDEETLTSRHKNEMCYLDIIIAQRLHELDLTGYTQQKNIDIYLVCLPSEITNACKVSPPEAESIYTDGILDPNRRPKFVLDQLKGKGSATYTCQYLQTPFNLEEQDITPSMFEVITSCKDDIVWDIWIDGAYTEKTENDPTGIDVIARSGNDIIIRDSFDVYLALPKLVGFVKELSTFDYFNSAKSRIFIEPKASGYSLYQYLLSDTDFNCVLIGQDNKLEAKLVQEGKTARHNMIIPKAQSRRTKIFKGTWNESFTTQICGFPRAAHDEHVDNLGYAVNHYYMKESTFIEDWALNILEKRIMGYFPTKLTSSKAKNKFSVSYEENEKGDIQMFDYPYETHLYRYICVLVLRSEGERGGNTSIVVYDRLENIISSLFVSNTITPKKASLKAVEMASLYDKAKLVVSVKNTIGGSKNEEVDLSHIALEEIRKNQYANIYFRLSHNDIKKKREREYGFEVNQSTSREIYYNLKDKAETNKIPDIPKAVWSEMNLLERKKENGEIAAKEGYEVNSALAYSIALKVSDEMSDDPRVKKVNQTYVL